jgi:hypothetical protein
MCWALPVAFYYENEFYAFVGLVGLKLFLGVVATAAGIVTDELKDLNDDTKMAGIDGLCVPRHSDLLQTFVS